MGNFKNLLKTLATHHQSTFARQLHHTDDIHFGKMFDVLQYKDNNIHQYHPMLYEKFQNFDRLLITKQLRINKFIYRPNIFVFFEGNFLKIIAVLCNDTKTDFYF